ncbi:MAG: GAF domain-containing protein [Flavobacteriales bacterium]
MSESLILPQTTDRKELYESLLPQIKSLVEGEKNFIANVSNITAALKETFGFLWIGFYFTDTADELVLGPFQGPIACTRIRKGKGVCGTSWLKKQTIIVPDVEEFPGHIACSSLSRSEIVIPLIDAEGNVSGVLDIDSANLHEFSEIDAHYLEQIALIIREIQGE